MDSKESTNLETISFEVEPRMALALKHTNLKSEYESFSRVTISISECTVSITGKQKMILEVAKFQILNGEEDFQFDEIIVPNSTSRNLFTLSAEKIASLSYLQQCKIFCVQKDDINY